MEIYQIDLHYHAGNERIDGKPLAAYLDFARKTGRRILGITDHLDLYLPEQGAMTGLYPRSAKGLSMLRREMDEQKEYFPEMQLFMGPEISFPLNEMRDEIVEISDYFICEPVPFRGDKLENTELLEKALEKAADIRRQTGREVFLAHPFRSQMYHRYDSFDFGIKEGRNPLEISEDEAGDFLGVDLKVFAEASKRLEVPIEVNGATLFNAESLNWPYFADVLKGAYLAMHRRKVSLVCGSDQHSIAVGSGACPVPASVFKLLGIKGTDIDFLRKIGAKL